MTVTSHEISARTKDGQTHQGLQIAGLDMEGEVTLTQPTCMVRTGNKSEKYQIATMNQSPCSMTLLELYSKGRRLF